MPEPIQNSSYPTNDPRASRPLQEILVAEIARNGSLPFSTFMESALYHPDHGYYLQPDLEVGKSGDFYTSVSVGPCFGLLLGKRLFRLWKQMGRPAEFTVSEAGAHHGHLAGDILASLHRDQPDFYNAIHYRIVEPQTILENKQREHLSDFSDKCFWSKGWDALQAKPGAIISNELFDAFPVDLITLENGRWMEKHVICKQEHFSWGTQELAKPELKKLASELSPKNYPEAYVTEHAKGIEKWVEKAMNSLSDGLWLTVDYGFSHSDYYLPERSDGTLRGFRDHQIVKNVLTLPGQQDLTSDVDFTRLLDAGMKCGLEPNGYADQARYLTAVAKDWMLDLEATGTAASNPLLRQFQTLTHPTKLGLRFKVLEMTTPGLRDDYPFAFSRAGINELKDR